MGDFLANGSERQQYKCHSSSRLYGCVDRRQRLILSNLSCWRVPPKRRMSITNRVLKAFSEETRHRLLPALESVRLETGRVLYEPGELVRHAFFPERAVISLLGLTGDGDAAELAIIGND